MLALLTPRFWLGLALVAALAFTHGFAYKAGRAAVRNAWDAEKLAISEAQAKITARRMDRIDTAAVALETDKAKIRTQFLTITKEVERVVQNPVYSDVCLDADGVRVVNASINPATAASQPTPAMPGPTIPE